MSDSEILEPAHRKRYHIHASKNSYVEQSFETIDEAIEKMKELAVEGYGSVSFRDSEGDDAWL